ncbi:hypothetical protein GCM10010497_29230 [Streptomyces cinereoruber]|uniref:Uncharacterized protein n=1 Tax=Streptomyces cinereoruber TaxID=67260 RepID=A0AAV4KK76_9ACTN|nr:hypothetical protein GCM10010497_29230 [Streptomyces cinereoruber]
MSRISNQIVGRRGTRVRSRDSLPSATMGDDGVVRLSKLFTVVSPMGRESARWPPPTDHPKVGSGTHPVSPGKEA